MSVEKRQSPHVGLRKEKTFWFILIHWYISLKHRNWQHWKPALIQGKKNPSNTTASIWHSTYCEQTQVGMVNRCPYCKCALFDCPSGLSINGTPTAWHPNISTGVYIYLIHYFLFKLCMLCLHLCFIHLIRIFNHLYPFFHISTQLELPTCQCATGSKVSDQPVAPTDQLLLRDSRTGACCLMPLSRTGNTWDTERYQQSKARRISFNDYFILFGIRTIWIE